MKRYLISPEKKQYRANLHCHSVLSDGHLTPVELRDLYKAHGYEILAITDHERPHCHQDLCEPDFLMITGYEGYLRPDPLCRWNMYAPEVHLNLFARDPMNTTMICFNEAFCKYAARDHALDEIAPRAGSERTREYTLEYINEYIRTARENGYLVAYNHPYWSMDLEEKIEAYEGIFSLEICNYGSWQANGLEYCGSLYDRLLRKGHRVFCHAADDNHNEHPVDDPENDSFGAYTMILAEDLTYDAVFHAMETGEMYASMGPRFHEVSIERNRVHVECSPVKHIYVHNGGKKPGHLHARPGEFLTSADFVIPHDADYIRASIMDGEGLRADTRGFFREEIGFPPQKD